MEGFFNTNIVFEGVDLGPIDKITRFSHRLVFGSEIGIVEDYFVREGESITTVANKLYGDPRLWWLLMIPNEYVSAFDWPLQAGQLEDYMAETFENPDAVDYWIQTDTKERVDQETEIGLRAGTIQEGTEYAPITFRQATYDANRDSRQIRVYSKKAAFELLKTIRETKL